MDEIIDMLKSENREIVKEGIKLMLADKDLERIIRKISMSYIFGYILSELVPFVHNNKSLIDVIDAALPSYQRKRFRDFLNSKIVPCEEMSYDKYFAFLRERSADYCDNPPSTGPEVLKRTTSTINASLESADTRQNGRGWVLTFESRDIGPAEVVHEEEWKALLYTKSMIIEFCYFYSSGYFPYIKILTYNL